MCVYGKVHGGCRLLAEGCSAKHRKCLPSPLPVTDAHSGAKGIPGGVQRLTLWAAGAVGMLGSGMGAVPSYSIS